MRDRVWGDAEGQDFHDELSDHKSLIDLKIHLRDNARSWPSLTSSTKDGKISAGTTTTASTRRPRTAS